MLEQLAASQVARICLEAFGENVRVQDSHTGRRMYAAGVVLACSILPVKVNQGTAPA